MIEPEQPLVVDDEALPSQQYVQAPVAEAPSPMGAIGAPHDEYADLGTDCEDKTASKPD